MHSTTYEVERILGNPIGALLGVTRPDSATSAGPRTTLTCYNSTRQQQTDPSGPPTDQKVGGSNPSERARSPRLNSGNAGNPRASTDLPRLHIDHLSGGSVEPTRALPLDSWPQQRFPRREVSATVRGREQRPPPTGREPVRGRVRHHDELVHDRGTHAGWAGARCGRHRGVRREGLRRRRSARGRCGSTVRRVRPGNEHVSVASRRCVRLRRDDMNHRACAAAHGSRRVRCSSAGNPDTPHRRRDERADVRGRGGIRVRLEYVECASADAGRASRDRSGRLRRRRLCSREAALAPAAERPRVRMRSSCRANANPPMADTTTPVVLEPKSSATRDERPARGPGGRSRAPVRLDVSDHVRARGSCIAPPARFATRRRRVPRRRVGGCIRHLDDAGADADEQRRPPLFTILLAALRPLARNSTDVLTYPAWVVGSLLPSALFLFLRRMGYTRAIALLLAVIAVVAPVPVGLSGRREDLCLRRPHRDHHRVRVEPHRRETMDTPPCGRMVRRGGRRVDVQHLRVGRVRSCRCRDRPAPLSRSSSESRGGERTGRHRGARVLLRKPHAV